MFLPMLQSPSSQTYLLVRSSRDPGQLVGGDPKYGAGSRCGSASLHRTVEQTAGHRIVCFAYVGHHAGCAGHDGRDALHNRHLWNGGVSVSKRLRELGIRMALGAQRKEVLQAALGRALKLLAFGSAAGLLLGILASRVLSAVVFHATPRDPLVLTCVV